MKKKLFHPYLIAFFLPFAACVVICLFNQIYPFGDNCILRVDMYHQYCPFFTEFVNKLHSGGSMQYSWNIGLGSDYISLYAYYLSSPFNFLLMLCPKGALIECMTLFILVKIGLCGSSFYCYLVNHFKIKEETEDRIAISLPALACSAAYALSGFVAAYYWDIMWMDCVALAPLIILGLERLVKEQRPAMYFVTLALAIWSNYYLSIMICIFLVGYFAVLFFEQKKHRLAAVGRFALYSLLAGGASAVLLLPEIKILSYSGSSGIKFPESVKWYFHLIEELTRTAAGVKTYLGDGHWPNLYVGAFALLFFILYLLNEEIAWKKKLPRIPAVAFFFLSFSNNYLDFIWHGLHFPDSLPGRQSFLFAFVMLVLAFEAMHHHEGITVKSVLVGMILWGIVFGFSYITGSAEAVSKPAALIFTAFLILCYGSLTILFLISDERSRKSLRDVGFALILTELVVNMAMTGFVTNNRSEYTRRVADYEAALSHLRGAEASGAFYRLEDTGRNTKNDSEYYGYSSATQFSSLMNINVSHFYQNVYMEGGKNFYCHNGATPLLSAMLSVRYRVSEYAGQENALCDPVGEFGSVNLYENKYVLPLGYMIPADLDEAWDVRPEDKIGNINRLGNLLGAYDELLCPASVKEEVAEGETKITIPDDGIYYASYVNCSADSLTIKTSAGKIERYSKTTHRYLFDFGELKRGDTVTVTNAKREKISFHVYRWNMDAFREVYERLSKNPFQIESVTDTQIAGKIRTSEPGRLLFSIPNEEGWTLYVDGKKTKIQSFQNTFISVDLDKGEYEIRLEYRTPYLLEGMLISGASIVLFVIAMLVRRRCCNGKKDEEL